MNTAQKAQKFLFHKNICNQYYLMIGFGYDPPIRQPTEAQERDKEII